MVQDLVQRAKMHVLFKTHNTFKCDNATRRTSVTIRRKNTHSIRFVPPCYTSLKMRMMRIHEPPFVTFEKLHAFKALYVTPISYVIILLFLINTFYYHIKLIVTENLL